MKRLLFIALLGVLAFLPAGCTETKDESTVVSSTAGWGDAPHTRPACVRGVHMTSYFIGSKKGRAYLESLLADTELNTVVIDIKEIEGDVYIPGIKIDGKIDTYVPAMPSIESYLKELKAKGVFTIARLVVFHDVKLAKKKPEWAIRSSETIPMALENGYAADVWVDRKGTGWADPYNKHVWDYNIEIAVKAAKLGFQGIQFDYIRFPSDGPTKLCVYSKPHSANASVKALTEFLRRAHEKLKPMGVELSIDVFGLVGSINGDMGIGQRLKSLIAHVDVISPMMYPSHYANGEFGIDNPNKNPYQTLHRSLRDTMKVIQGTSVELRPYLQDFSMGGVKYGPRQVRDQIEAAQDLGIGEWLLWNAACKYTKDALVPAGREELMGQPFVLDESTPTMKK